MSWPIHPGLDLRNDRIIDADADRQMRTAAEILHRLDDRPGLVLADEVGMGKTYVALAVAVSVLEATRRKRPVVVMVPAAVAEKWPTEWAVFEQRCLPPGHGLRASGAVRRGSDFLKLLDDPARTRRHLIFLTHGALTRNLDDPFIGLAFLRHATRRRPDLLRRRPIIARTARRLLNYRPFADAATVEELLASNEARWRDIWNRQQPQRALDDDPVPFSLLPALARADLSPLREALLDVPMRRSATYDSRLQAARRLLARAMKDVWKDCLGELNERLPLLVLDEAHHLKNPNQLARLFANDEAAEDADALQGPLGNMFEKMLFLTATPFQLGHHELLNVLDRFHGVRWPTVAARRQFDDELTNLGRALDRAQASALRFERAWSRVDAADASTVEPLRSFVSDDELPERVGAALTIGAEASRDIDAAETLLSPWVIRHVKAHRWQRRRYWPGRSIIDDHLSELGLPVGGSATLPFLLAARAQALASLDGVDGERSTRAYFAYGLASSFEAYADTRRNGIAELDDVNGSAAEGASPADASPRLRWYLDRIAAALPSDGVDGWAAHPKIAATVDRVRTLWCNGEKTLVFCFYVETGRALRSHISRALRNEIVSRAARALDIEDDAGVVFAELDRIGERLLRSESRGRTEFRRRVGAFAAGLGDDAREQVVEIVTRFMRTPAFLVRFVDLSKDVAVDDLLGAFDRTDGSGATLANRVEAFVASLCQKVDVEREELLETLTGIQTGGIQTATDSFDPSERSARREVLLPNVRLANGGVRRETRRRLMLAFNTPFFPEVLVASAVMAEGVDLQQDCRYVIHHDLDWNPSTLEQRTGRIDRIGSKAEAVQQPVVVYEPYLGGTHDEKMYRVVKDRERWFGIVMGETPETGELATTREEARVPLPLALAETLSMDLSLPGRRPSEQARGPQS